METIVPIDSGRCQRHPNRDIKDEEIRSILEKLSKTTDKITLIFDCCHSGHITRDPSGQVFRGVESDVAPFELLIENSRGFAAENFRYVLFAACRADEKAKETECNGLWTLSLKKAINLLSIKQLRPTHRNVFEQAFIEVALNANVQHPLIEGPKEQQNRIMFDTEIVFAKPYACVKKISEQSGKKLAILDVGEAHGVTIGSKFALFPLNCRSSTEEDLNLLVTVDTISATECSVLIPTHTNFTVENGCRAYEKFHAFDDLSISVTIVISTELTKWLETSNKDRDINIPLFVEKLKSFIDNCPYLNWKETSDGAFCVIHLIAPFPQLNFSDNVPIYSELQQRGFNLNTPSIVYFGQANKILALPIHLADMDNTFHSARETIANLGRYYRGLRIRNENLVSLSNNPIHDKIKMTVDWSHDKTSWNRIENCDMAVLHDGYYLQVNIINGSSKDVYIALLDFAEDGAITQVFPPPGGQEIIARGNKLMVKFDDPLTIASDLIPFETLKLFATTLPTDFRLLIQNGFRSGSEHSALEELLITSATRTIPQKRSSEDYWTSDQCMFRIEERQNC